MAVKRGYLPVKQGWTLKAMKSHYPRKKTLLEAMHRMGGENDMPEKNSDKTLAELLYMFRKTWGEKHFNQVVGVVGKAVYAVCFVDRIDDVAKEGCPFKPGTEAYRGYEYAMGLIRTEIEGHRNEWD